MEQAQRSRLGFYEIKALIRSSLEKELQRDKEDIDTFGPLKSDDVSFLRGDQYFYEYYLNSGIDDVQIMDDYARRFISEHKIDVDSDLYQQLKTLIAEARLSMRRALLEHNAKASSFEFVEREQQEKVGSPEAVQPVVSAMSLALSEATGRYLDERTRAGTWGVRPREEKVKHIDLLIEILGADKNVDSVSIDDARRVKDIIVRYPVNRRKNPLIRDLSLEEALSISGVDKLNIQTVNKYLQTYSDLFEYLLDARFVTDNVFSKSRVKEGRAASENERQIFSLDQIGAIISAVTGEPGEYYTKQYQKWGMLIGVYTGARLNEIAQLELSDVVEVDGVLSFSINDDGDTKQLKNRSSHRTVPVHPALIRLGFAAYVAALKERGQTRLFPELPYYRKDGYGRNLGRWFNEKLLPRLGFKTSELVFHSLRHAFVTYLARAGVAESIVSELVGHEQKTITMNRYFKGYESSQKLSAIEQLPYSY
jgi:integrase